MRSDDNGNFIVKKNYSRLTVFLTTVAPVAVADLMACAPVPVSTSAVTINSPLDGAELFAGDITVRAGAGAERFEMT